MCDDWLVGGFDALYGIECPWQSKSWSFWNFPDQLLCKTVEAPNVSILDNLLPPSFFLKIHVWTIEKAQSCETSMSLQFFGLIDVEMFLYVV